MKYAWVDQNTEVFALTEMCAVLDVSISGYRAWKRGGTPGRKRLTDTQTLTVPHQDIGQMDVYVRMYDDLKRGPDDNPTVGIILYAKKDASVVRSLCCMGTSSYTMSLAPIA